MNKFSLNHHVAHAFAALRYSLAGIMATLKSETAFMQEALALPALPLLALLYGVPWGLVLLVLCGWLLLMAVEMLNTAIEHVCNLVTLERNPHIKAAKDAGSGAVFLILCANVLFWLYLLYTYR